MVGEIVAIVGTGVSILVYLAKLQAHLDGRFDSAEHHALRQDTELQLLNSKMEAGLQLHDFRLRALEQAMQPGQAARSQGGN